MNGDLILYLKSIAPIVVIQLNSLRMKLPAAVLNAEVQLKIKATIMAAANGVLLPLTIKETCVPDSGNQRTDLSGGQFSSTSRRPVSSSKGFLYRFKDLEK